MSTFRKTWTCCGGTTETVGWEPERCPLCTARTFSALAKNIIPPAAKSITIFRRDFGHWDIGVSDKGRVFAIRGGPGDYYVRDERKGANCEDARKAYKFASLPMAAAWAIDCLMYELIVAEGQTPAIIPGWNVGQRW